MSMSDGLPGKNNEDVGSKEKQESSPFMPSHPGGKRGGRR